MRADLVDVHTHFLLNTITTKSARGPMDGESASTPRVHVDVELAALVKSRPVGSVPPTPDPDYGDLRRREARSGELVIPGHPPLATETDQGYRNL